MGIEKVIKTEPSYSSETVQPVQNTEKATSISEKGTVDEKDNNVSLAKGNSQKEGRKASESSISEAVAKANRSMEKTKCEYSYHKETNRVSIKVVDTTTNKVIREIPPEESLKMLEKMWEMAGILVDEKR